MDVVRLMYNLIACSDNYLLWQYCRNEPALAANAITDFNVDNATTDLFKIKEEITGQTGNNVIKYVEIMVSLKCLSNFFKTPEIYLINCYINLDVNWSKKCVIVATAIENQGATFPITDTTFYVPVVTLSTQDKTTLLK